MILFIDDSAHSKHISFSKITPDKDIYIEFAAGDFNEHEHIIISPEELLRIIASVSDSHGKLCFKITL